MTQPNEGRSFSWQTAIAIGGLIATLIGLWISYQGKEKELEQAQAKIETTYREGEERKQNKAKKRAELDGRMLKIDADINATELEIRRGTAGLMFAPEDQKPIAMRIIEVATAQRNSLLTDKSKLQETISALPSD